MTGAKRFKGVNNFPAVDLCFLTGKSHMRRQWLFGEERIDQLQWVIDVQRFAQKCSFVTPTLHRLENPAAAMATRTDSISGKRLIAFPGETASMVANNSPNVCRPNIVAQRLPLSDKH